MQKWVASWTMALIVAQAVMLQQGLGQLRYTQMVSLICV